MSTGATSAQPHQRLAMVLTVGVTAVWGSTFPMIHSLVATIPAVDFLAVRFCIAAVLMVVIFWRPTRALDRRQVLTGLGCGAVYGLAQILQTIGLAHTEASRSGFITGLYVVLTPMLGALLLRDRIPAATWVGAALSLVGLGALSLTSLHHIAWGFGETVTLLSAVVYALHIVLLGRVTNAENATGLATIQIVAVAAVCLISAVPDGIKTPSSTGGWAAIVYTAAIAGAGAMWAQTWAQSQLDASRTAIIMTMEPVFAAVFAVLFGGESITVRMVLGGGLILAAMYVVEFAFRPGGAPVVDEALHHEG